jgi:DNA-binding NarL/FixJ family response regulator
VSDIIRRGLSVLGELATVASNHADSAPHLGDALGLAEACAAPYERALCLLVQAEWHAASGDRDQALWTLAEARADGLVASLAPMSARTHPAELSAREAEVLILVARRLTNAQVTDRLFVPSRTVDEHLRALYGKLGVDNRAIATRLAGERGLA